MINQLISKAKLNPKKLFLIDVIGALLSAFLLGVVLVRFNIFFGIPVHTLYLLALLPLLFACYDYYCYTKESMPKKYLNNIAILNILYSAISLSSAVYHLNVITFWGWAYIIIEIMIILLLASI